MKEYNDLTAISEKFPIVCWVFPTRGISDGVVVRFPEGFYLKIYYSEKQRDAYDIIGGWNGEVSPSLRTTVGYKDMNQWCSRITCARAFMEVIYESRTSNA